MESLARDDDFVLPDNIDTSQHCEMVGDSQTFANYLPTAGAISIACYAYLFWMYFVLKSPILKRHPTTLAIFKCFFELLFVQQYLWVPQLSNKFEAYSDDTTVAPYHCNASNLAGAMSFLSQFALLGSELCFLVISIDLRNAYTNPFTSFKQNRVKYVFLVVFFAAMSAGLMLACGPQVYGMSRLGLFWMQPRRNTDISINYPQALLFYMPSVFIFGYCLWANFQFYKGVSQGLAQTIGNRLSIMERSKRYTASYVAYASLVFVIEFVSFLMGNSLSNQITHVPAFFYALRGVWAVIVILYCNEQEASWHTLHPFRLSLPQELLKDVAAERLLLQPHLNVALRAEILYFATQGIICAASDMDDSTGEVLDDAVDAEAHNETRLFGYEVTDTSLPPSSATVAPNEVNSTNERPQPADYDVESDSRHSLFNLFEIDNAGMAVHSKVTSNNSNNNNNINLQSTNTGTVHITGTGQKKDALEGLQRLRRMEQAQSKRISARYLVELADELKALGADESLLPSHEADNATDLNTRVNSGNSAGNHVNFNPLLQQPQQQQQKGSKLRFRLPSTDNKEFPSSNNHSVDSGSSYLYNNSNRSNSRSYSKDDRAQEDQNGIEMADSASYNTLFAHDPPTFTGVNINSLRTNNMANNANNNNGSLKDSGSSSSAKGSSGSGWRRLNSNDSVRSASAESVASNYSPESPSLSSDHHHHTATPTTTDPTTALDTRQSLLRFSFNQFSFSHNSSSNSNNNNLATDGHLSSNSMNSSSSNSRWNGLLQSAVSRATAALSPAYQEFRFKDYAPRLFARIRKMHRISARDYAAAFETTCRERFSEGRSGAFLFFSQDERFIVKTMSSEESVSLRRILPLYVAHLAQYPESLLVRFLGVHSLVMYGVELCFCVMLNVFPTEPLSERYDLKGSWVNRHGHSNSDRETRSHRRLFNNRRKRLRRRKQKALSLPQTVVDLSDSDSEEEAAPLYQDNDLQLPISLQPSVAKGLANTIRRDIIFLRDLNFMDYSLLIGVRRERFQVVSPPAAGEDTVGTASAAMPQVTPVSSKATRDTSTSTSTSSGDTAAATPAVHLLNTGGLRAAEVEGPSVYYVGVIDVLQQWDFRKRLEQFFKTHFLMVDIEGLSAIEPRGYCSRFWSRAVLDTFEHLEHFNDDPDNP